MPHANLFFGRMHTAIAALGSVLLLASGAARGADIELSDGGDIAAAVAQTAYGDTITLGGGTYAVHGLSVENGVAIVAKAGCEVTIDLQSQADGITLNHAEARLEGCKVINCRTKAVVVNGGAQLVDCDFTGLNEKSGTSVENFSLIDGAIRGCMFRNFTGKYAYKNYIVKVTGGTLADSTLEDIGSEFDWMVYVDGASAVVTNLVIRNSPGKGTGGTDNLNNGVLYLANGLVTHSVVTNSGSVGAAKNGTVMIVGGTMRNTLVADCKSPAYPGVYMTGGRLENCTIANNTTKSAAVKSHSLTMTGGTAVNNIFSDGAANGKSVVVTGGTFENNLIPVDIGYGAGNQVGIPYFVNPAAGNYMPGLLSLAVDNAQTLDWITAAAVDLAGEARVKGAAPDIGAFEGPYGADDPLACGFTVGNAQFRADAADTTVSFAARVAGQGAEGVSCAWYLDGGASPIGTGLTLETDRLLPGLHTMKLVATPAGDGAVPLEYELPDCVLIYPERMYVDAGNATPEYPYDSPAKAATSLQDIFSFLDSPSPFLPGYPAGEDAVVVIEVADGTYSLNDLILKSPVRLVAKAGAAPVLDIGNVDPGLSFTDARQVLDGFTVINGRTRTLRFYSGSCMRNCTVLNLKNAIGGTSSHFILVSGATVSNCVFRGASSEYAYFDPVVELEEDALVSDCVFENMENLDMVAYLTAAASVLSNCVFRNSPMTSKGGNLRYQAITLGAGLVTHCVITNFGGTASTGRGDKTYGGVVSLTGAAATLRNCLIADCSAQENAGIDMGNGAVENCTVIGGTLKTTASGSQRNLKQAGGRVVNSIFWNDSGIDGVTVSGGTFEYSSSVLRKQGAANKAGDPGLDAAFVPSSTSLARDCGTQLDWMTDGSVDLRGSNRVVHAVVDLGAFEGDEPPAELVLTLESVFSQLDGDNVVTLVTPCARIGYDPVAEPEFVWALDGVSAGRSSGAREFSLPPRATPYVIDCSISSKGQYASATISLPIHSGVFYVSPDGANEAPYDSWERAAKTLDTILALPHPAADTRTYTVHLSAGAHSTCGFTLTTPMVLVGEDGAVFDSGEAPALNHADCSISNLVFNNVGFVLSNGAARDIVVRNRSGQSGKTLLTLSGGVCDGLVVTNCRTTAWNFQYGVALSGDARLSNFVIDNCAGYDQLLGVSDNAVASNGTITASNCVLGGGQGNTHEYLISASGGLVSHVSVMNCGDTRAQSSWNSRDGTVRVAGGTVRNCLIAGNRSTDCAGVNLTGGCLESCTVIVNDGDVLHKTGYGTYGSCLTMSGGFATNCVFYTAEPADGAWSYCRVTGGKIGNCWLSVKGADVTPAGDVILVGADPCFRSAGGWDYIPEARSPLVGMGVCQPWMTGATDLSGVERIRGRRPEIGAFESQLPGLILRFR